ncbi:MAG: cupin domain-containing protein [Deltaproteobacteria bacterium]|nr:cupin domain-containing protein [Deltaproteobacteria bacterium]
MKRMVLIVSFLSCLAFGASEPERIVLPTNPQDYFEILSKKNSLCMRSGYVTLQPGQNIGFHDTGDFEELIIPFEGRGEMETKGAGRIAFEKGILIHAFPHAEHNVWNRGKDVLRYIYVVADTKCGVSR